MAFEVLRSPGFLIGRTAYLLRTQAREALEAVGLGLTPEEAFLMAVLSEKDGRRVGELAEVSLRDATTVTRQLDGLEGKGLLTRSVDPEDRRAVQVLLTDAGRMALFQMLPAFHSMRQRVLRDIPAEDIDVLLRTLEQIKANLLGGP